MVQNWEGLASYLETLNSERESPGVNGEVENAGTELQSPFERLLSLTDCTDETLSRPVMPKHHVEIYLPIAALKVRYCSCCTVAFSSDNLLQQLE